MTATGSSGTWTQTLRKRSEGGEAIIRTDAYHNNWGKGDNRGREFFTKGTCFKLAKHTSRTVLRWKDKGETQ